jgi:hypothetical protein
MLHANALIQALIDAGARAYQSSGPALRRVFPQRTKVEVQQPSRQYSSAPQGIVSLHTCVPSSHV